MRPLVTSAGGEPSARGFLNAGPDASAVARPGPREPGDDCHAGPGGAAHGRTAVSRRYALYDHGTLCIVECRMELGYAGADKSARLFAVDAWRLSEGIGVELGRGTREWQHHAALPGCDVVYAAPPTLLAEFDAGSGYLGVEDAAGATGDVARYVGMEYDESRWRALDPDEYRVALLAGAGCASCWRAASVALASVTHAQMEGFERDDLLALMSHPHGPLRLAAIQTMARAFPAPPAPAGG